jgi:hypothetical protein
VELKRAVSAYQANINMKVDKELMKEFVSIMNMVRSSKNMNTENCFQFTSGGTVKRNKYCMV